MNGQLHIYLSIDSKQPFWGQQEGRSKACASAFWPIFTVLGSDRRWHNIGFYFRCKWSMKVGIQFSSVIDCHDKWMNGPFWQSDSKPITKLNHSITVFEDPNLDTTPNQKVFWLELLRIMSECELCVLEPFLSHQHNPELSRDKSHTTMIFLFLTKNHGFNFLVPFHRHSHPKLGYLTEADKRAKLKVWGLCHSFAFLRSVYCT